MAPAAAEINAPQTRVSRKIVHLNTRQPKNLMQPLGYGSRFHRLERGDLSSRGVIKASYCLSVYTLNCVEKKRTRILQVVSLALIAFGRKTTSSGLNFVAMLLGLQNEKV